jgi:hypothetical protein
VSVLAWRSRKIKIKFGHSTDDAETMQVAAEVSGHFAVHQTVRGSSATVTHIPTGYRVLHCENIPAAKAAAQFIEDLGLDWNFKDPEKARLIAGKVNARRDELHAIAWPGTANGKPTSRKRAPEANKK